MGLPRGMKFPYQQGRVVDFEPLCVKEMVGDSVSPLHAMLLLGPPLRCIAQAFGARLVLHNILGLLVAAASHSQRASVASVEEEAAQASSMGQGASPTSHH